MESALRYYRKRLTCRVLNFSGARPASDISDHLETLAFECSATNPKLIVELGTRGGVSTQTLAGVAANFGAHMLSVDIEDCSAASPYARWKFICSDDIAFAAQFRDWCASNGIEPLIDFLFIDTSHVYEHTVKEIAVWFPYLEKACRVAFHDTNCRDVYRMKDGTWATGWGNQRGVIRAVEEFLDTKIDERRQTISYANGWKVSHVPYCSGMTVLERHG